LTRDKNETLFIKGQRQAMPIEIRMPALSPTMEAGTLAKWLVKPGDHVSSGDILAEIETDKATMEFEAVDEGTIVAIVVSEGTEEVKVGTVIALLAGEDDGDQASPRSAAAVTDSSAAAASTPTPIAQSVPAAARTANAALKPQVERVIASPLVKRIAALQGIDLKTIRGTGPNGRIVKADLAAILSEGAAPAPLRAAVSPAISDFAPDFSPDFGIPYQAKKLNNVRKIIARRLTEAKQTIPHIYLTVDVRLDALLCLRGDLNAALAANGVKLSVNDLLIKALEIGRASCRERVSVLV